ncbi:MAG: SpoIID/LytB domain-containing protein [Candidatus Omnitrophica bacterium]|nr:SpoIID/LytB domain-containing protein [Candidatus Omnitrophota bacterium]
MLSKIKIGFAVAAVLLAALAFFSLADLVRGHRASAMDVRVLIVSGRGEARIGPGIPFKVTDLSGGNVLMEDKKPLKSMAVRTEEGDLLFGERLLPSAAVKLTPLKGQGIGVNGVLYRGDIIIRNNDGSLECINELGIEEYLRGVLPEEVYAYWPSSALKAQAIASRSFAAYRALRSSRRAYDLRHDARSQVYGGMKAENMRTTRAVMDTNGKVLSYDGKVFPAYFSACCGGYRESSASLWGEELEPLKGGRCIWCRFSPVFRWREDISKDFIAGEMRKAGYGVERVDSLKAFERDSSGRPAYIEISSAKRKVKVGTEDFRIMVGQDLLKSSLFRMRETDDKVIFHGRGWGHGVGMCQWGAFGMSMFLRSTGNILKTYYPGTEIVDLKQMLK